MAEIQNTPIGHVSIATFLDEKGQVATSLDLDGMTHEEAIGRLTTATDRIRAIVADEWAEAEGEVMPMECPACGHNLFDHDNEGDDADDE